MFRALVLHEEGGKIVPRIEAVDEDRLPPGEITVAVEYSTLNYKDGMILEGIGRLVRNYPHVPGVDFAGTVERSNSPEFKPGDPVILTGWRVGETQWGGYAEKARVQASYLVRRPEGLSARQAMTLGTADLIDRATLAAKPSRPLDTERWAGAIDAVGGTTLATILTQLKYRASVAACGLAGGSDLPATVIPFLLRGVNLLGIDSVMCPRDERIEAWTRLVRFLPIDRLDRMTEAAPLSAVAELAPRILA